jgi:hypothetical protein
LTRTHGKVATYEHGCRCDDCKAASRERSHKRHTTWRSDRAMTTEERARLETEPEFFYPRLRVGQEA